MTDARDEIERVHRLAELTASGEDGAAVVGTAQQELTELLSLDGCLFEALPYDTEVPVLERSGALTQQSHRYQGNGFLRPAPGGRRLPSRSRPGRPVGRFALHPAAGCRGDPRAKDRGRCARRSGRRRGRGPPMR